MTRARWTALALAALAVAVYANAPANGFALDDEFVIVDNERVHGLDSLHRTLVEPYWPDSPGRLGLYRPLTTATYAVEWELWGDNPLPFHLTNVALHALATLLVFLLLHALVGLAGGVAGAAVFAVHPVHVEAVANTVGRAEVLAAVFVLAAAVVYLRGDLTRSRGRLWGGALLMALAYFLGLASKEIAVTLPALLLVLEAGRDRMATDGAPAEMPGRHGRGASAGGAASSERWTAGLRRYGRRVLARWPVYLALAVAGGGYLALRARVLGTTVGNDQAGFLAPLSTGERVMTAVSVWPEYLRLMMMPVELVADYSPGVLMPVREPGPELLAGVLVGVMAILVVVYAWNRQRTVALGVLLFAVAVLPVSNLVIPIGVLLAERTLYLPSVGLAAAVGGAWLWLATARPDLRRTAAGILGVAVLVAGARTWVRTPTWKSTDAVIGTLARDHPESFRVQWLLAARLLAQDRTDDALARFRYAADLVPDHYQLRMQYARALLQTGRHDAAITGFRAARDAVPEHPEAHVFLLIALLRADRPADAVAEGRRALRIHADHRGVHHQLAIAYARSGDVDAALEARRESIRLGAERAAWPQFVHEAELLLRLGRPDDARLALDRAHDRAPDTAAVPSLDALRRAVDTADPAVLPYP